MNDESAERQPLIGRSNVSDGSRPPVYSSEQLSVNEGIILHVSAVSLNTLFIWHTKDHDIMLKQCMII